MDETTKPNNDMDKVNKYSEVMDGGARRDARLINDIKEAAPSPRDTSRDENAVRLRPTIIKPQGFTTRIADDGYGIER